MPRNRNNRCRHQQNASYEPEIPRRAIRWGTSRAGGFVVTLPASDSGYPHRCCHTPDRQPTPSARRRESEERSDNSSMARCDGVRSFMAASQPSRLCPVSDFERWAALWNSGFLSRSEISDRIAEYWSITGASETTGSMVAAGVGWQGGTDGGECKRESRRQNSESSAKPAWRKPQFMIEYKS